MKHSLGTPQEAYDEQREWDKPTLQDDIGSSICTIIYLIIIIIIAIIIF